MYGKNKIKCKAVNDNFNQNSTFSLNRNFRINSHISRTIRYRNRSEKNLLLKV